MNKSSLITTVLFASLVANLSPVQAANFTITGSSTAAQTLSSGQTGTVTSTGTLAVNGSTVAVTVTGNATITNSGTINQTGTGRTIRDNTGGLTLNVTNNAGALMQAADADVIQMNKANSNVTFDNSGSVISLNPSAAGSQAIDFGAITTGSNTLHNFSTGLLKAIAADAVRPGVNGVIINEGTIQAVPVTEGVVGSRDASSSDGIDAQFNTGVQITNTGNISGRHGITGGETQPNFAISVTNNIGGVITGLNGSGINIDGAVTGSSVVSSATIVNNGTITGNYDSTKYDIGDGDGVDVDGTVNLTNNGIIRGIGAAGAGNNSEGVSIGGGTIVNNAGAEISGQNPTASGAQGHGILVDDSNGGNAFAAATITNSGLIRGYSGFAIKTIGTFDNSVTNNAGGTIRGAGSEAAIQLGNGNDIVINRGAIIGDGGKAIDLGGGNNTLRIEGGSASVAGNISGGSGGLNSLILHLGTGNSFSYSGVLSNFNTVDVQSGRVSLFGSSIYTGATTVSGGTLVAKNTAGSATGFGSVTVKNLATLAGDGRIGGDVFVESGGIISPGESAGILSFGGNLNLVDGARFAFDLGPNSANSDLLVIDGQLVFSGPGKALFDFINSGVDVGTYTLLTFDSSTGVDLSRFDFGSPHDFVGNFSLNSNSLSLVVTAAAVPEPASTATILGGTCLAAIALRVFRSRKTRTELKLRV